jgi:hypothetical protein
MEASSEVVFVYFVVILCKEKNVVKFVLCVYLRKGKRRENDPFYFEVARLGG